MFELLRVAALVVGSALPVLVPPVAHYCEGAIFSAQPAPRPFGTGAQAPRCEPYVVNTPKGSLYLAVARTQPDREHGLMNVTDLAPNAGMLFAFLEDDPREFWMKNTLIPLDIVFVDAHGVVTSVAARVPASTAATPESAVARRRGHGKYVIELRAGEAEALGLAPGTRLVLSPVEADP